MCACVVPPLSLAQNKANLGYVSQFGDTGKKMLLTRSEGTTGVTGLRWQGRGAWLLGLQSSLNQAA